MSEAPRGMDATKLYKLMGFGAMDVTKPYKFIGFGAMDATKLSKLIGFGFWLSIPGGGFVRGNPGRFSIPGAGIVRSERFLAEAAPKKVI